MAMLAASIVIYTLFLTPVFNKRAKPTMSNWVIVVPFNHKIVNVWLPINMFFSRNRATILLERSVAWQPIPVHGWCFGWVKKTYLLHTKRWQFCGRKGCEMGPVKPKSVGCWYNAFFKPFWRYTRTTWVWDNPTHNMGWVGVPSVCPRTATSPPWWLGFWCCWGR